MSGTRILWGQVLAVCSIVVAGIWGATQWTAAALGYQAQLGEPIGHVFGIPVYPPPAIFWWWFSYEAYAPSIFETGGMIAAGSGVAAVVAAVAMSLWRARELKRAETYGSARWAIPRGWCACPAKRSAWHPQAPLH